MYKSIFKILMLMSLLLCTGDILYAMPDEAETAEMVIPEIKAKMDAHIEKAKRNNPGKYQIMMQKANNSVTGCLSCHVDLVENKKFKTR